MVLRRVFVYFAALFACAFSFRLTNFVRSRTACCRPNVPLQMSDGGAGDPLNEIKAKMQSDPNYNPMTDPAAASALDALIPDYLKEIPNAIERLSVAFKDATTGTDAITDIDSVAASLGNKRDLISSPQSDFFSKGMQGEGAVDSEELQNLLSRLKQQYPEVPYE